MALNFPSSPNLNDEYTVGSKTWVWNGSAWAIKTAQAGVLLDILKTVDGTASGLDADLLDGYHASIQNSPSTVVVRDANDLINITGINLTTNDVSTPVVAANWNTTDATWDFQLKNGVTLQAGQELHFYGRAVGSIPNGSIVMFAGAQGDGILLKLADASAPGFHPAWIVGVATQSFTNNEWGYVTWFGKVRDINTYGHALGAVLYLDPTTPGGHTDVEPTAPNPKIQVSAVVRVSNSPSSNDGILMVRPSFAHKLSELQDVYINSQANGHVLVWNATNSRWENTAQSSITSGDSDKLDGQHGSYYLDWANTTNKPDPTVTVTLTGDVSGTANTTLTDLGSGTVSITTTVGALQNYLPLSGGTLTDDLTVDGVISVGSYPVTNLDYSKTAADYSSATLDANGVMEFVSPTPGLTATLASLPLGATVTAKATITDAIVTAAFSGSSITTSNSLTGDITSVAIGSAQAYYLNTDFSYATYSGIMGMIEIPTWNTWNSQLTTALQQLQIGQTVDIVFGGSSYTVTVSGLYNGYALYVTGGPMIPSQLLNSITISNATVYTKGTAFTTGTSSGNLLTFTNIAPPFSTALSNLTTGTTLYALNISKTCTVTSNWNGTSITVTPGSVMSLSGFNYSYSTHQLDTVLHAGNYSQYALPKTGGTVTGNLAVSGILQASSNLNVGGDVYITGTIQGPAISSPVISGTLNHGGVPIYSYSGSGLSFLENFYPNASQSAHTFYHFGSESGRQSAALVLARSGYFSAGMGARGDGWPGSTFLSFFSDNGSTGYEWRNGNAYPSNIYNGNLLMRLTSTGALNVASALTQANNQVLHAGNYSSYALPLSGGTVTGNLVLSNGYIDLASHLYARGDWWVLNSGSNGWNRIIARNNGAPYLENITYGGNTILHAGNYSSYALPLSGGGLTGNLGILRKRLTFSSTSGDANHSIYNNYDNIDGEGGWDGLKMNVYNGLRVRTGNASGATPTLNFEVSMSGVGITGSTWVSSGQNDHRLIKDNSHLNLRDQWGNLHLKQGDGGGVYIDGNSHHWRNNAGTTEWGFMDGSSFTYNGNSVLHAGNYSSYALPLSGGTVSGTVTASRFTGAGYSMISSATLDLSGLSSTTWYPVTIPIPFARPTRMRIQNGLNSNVPSWSTHPSGFSLLIEWTSNGSGWGTIGVQRHIFRWTENFSNVTIVGGLSQMIHSSEEVIYLLGGGVYYFEADQDVAPTVRSTSYTNNGLTVAPSTTIVNSPWNQTTSTIAAGNFLLSGNQVLHAGNYSSYALPLNAAFTTTVAADVPFAFRKSSSAANNNATVLFQSDLGNHSWGLIGEFRVAGTGDRPSIMFSSGAVNTSWSLGFVTYQDDTFRIVKNHGYRAQAGAWTGNNSGWGTEYLTINTSGVVNAPGTLQQGGNQVLHAGNYTSYSPSLSGSYKNLSVGGLYSRYNYNESTYISDATSAYSLSPDYGTTTVAMHSGHGLFGSWATTLTMSGYERYGAYQISGNYNASTPELAIRNYNQTVSGWTSWAKLLSSANYSSYALPLSGGTLSGELTLNGSNTWFGGANLRNNNTFLFLTNSAGAQNARFNGIQVSDNYTGTIPTNGILLGTDTTIARHSYGYGSILIDGARNGYYGTMYNTSVGVAGWMTQGNTSGYYNYSYGWKYYHDTGNFWIFSGTYGGGTSYLALHSGNYSSYAVPASGYTNGGSATFNFYSASGVGLGGQAGTLVAYSAGTSYSATMSFHRPGAYAVNMGLDSDNVFRLGGWSDGTNVYRFTVDTSGNFNTRGAITQNGSQVLHDGNSGRVRAWVKFNGTNGTISSSFNVTSVTRSSTGVYTVNFTSAMPDTNYSVSGNTSSTLAGINTFTTTTFNTASLAIQAVGISGGTVVVTDPSIVSVAIFR